MTSPTLIQLQMLVHRQGELRLCSLPHVIGTAMLYNLSMNLRSRIYCSGLWRFQAADLDACNYSSKVAKKFLRVLLFYR